MRRRAFLALFSIALQAQEVLAILTPAIVKLQAGLPESEASTMESADSYMDASSYTTATFQDNDCNT